MRIRRIYLGKSSASLLPSFSVNSQETFRKASDQVWAIVQAHNTAWSVHEDINEQLKYVHDDVVFVKPPFKEIMRGKEKYKSDYQEWMKHAEVEYFREFNPVITMHGNGNFAIVSFGIEMSFKYDDKFVDDWKGADMMTLVKENGKWLITSDMFARQIQLSA